MELFWIGVVTLLSFSGAVCILKGRYSAGGSALTGPFGLFYSLVMLRLLDFEEGAGIVAPILACVRARPGSWWWKHRYDERKRSLVRQRPDQDEGVDLRNLHRARAWLIIWFVLSTAFAVLSVLGTEGGEGLVFGSWFASSSVATWWTLDRLRLDRRFSLPERRPSRLRPALRSVRHPHPIAGVLALQAALVTIAVVALRSGL